MDSEIRKNSDKGLINMDFKVIDRGIVASRPKQMYGWPGIAKAANGDIIVVASERKFHVDPYGREVIIRSNDNGKTWILPQEIYNSPLDDRDANLLALEDGTLILSFFTSTYFEGLRVDWNNRLRDEIRNRYEGSWMLFSKDNGYTWSENPVRMPVGRRISPFCFSDGSLVTIAINYCDDKEKEMAAWRSYDMGKSWEKTWVFDCPKSMKGSEGSTEVPSINENHALEVSPEKIVILFRCVDNYLYQADSEDYGRTWSDIRKLDIWGLPPHMLKLSDGRILCAYGHRRDPFSIRAVLSYDNGRTWDSNNIVTLHQWEDQPDMGYPSSIEIGKGEILTIFYCSRRDKPGPECPYKAWNSEFQTEGLPEGILYIRYRI
jgi:hypothetical protein